jgi:signal transduction histidine kinase
MLQIANATDGEVLNHLAQFLYDHRDRITKEWMAAVHRDPKIATSETIAAHQLRDHMPELLDDLVDLLRAPLEDQAHDRADHDARAHGHYRWEQGYRLGELLRELSRVRMALIAQLLSFEEQTPDFAGSVRKTALQRVHFFFDEIAAHSAEQFVGEQQALLHAKNEQLCQTDSSRLRLLRTVAHELRNSINAAQLTVQELTLEGEGEVRSELTSILARNIAQISALTHDLLDFSLVLDTNRPLRVERLAARNVVDELLCIFQPVAKAKGLLLEGDCDPRLSEVVSDSTKLRQITHNLVSNAVKYTAQGRVHFSLRAVDDTRWSFIVDDTGPGIASKDRERLFVEFHRAENTAHLEGTGLGLAIVKQLVDLLGGDIRVESQTGCGSRFEVILPQCSAALSVAPVAS